MLIEQLCIYQTHRFRDLESILDAHRVLLYPLNSSPAPGNTFIICPNRQTTELINS